MIGIEKPSIEALDLTADGTYGKFVVEPLERGFGITTMKHVILIGFIFLIGYLFVPSLV